MTASYYVGIVYDIIGDCIIDRCCVEYNDEDLALYWAKELCRFEGHDEDMAYVLDIPRNAIIFND